MSQRNNRIKAYLYKEKQTTNKLIENLERNSVEINKFKIKNNNFDTIYISAIRDDKEKG